MILEDGGALPGRNMGHEIGSPDSYLYQGYQTTAGKLCTCSPRSGDSEGFELEEGLWETSGINRRCAPSEWSVSRSIEGCREQWRRVNWEREENGGVALGRKWGSANEDTLLQVRQSGTVL